MEGNISQYKKTPVSGIPVNGDRNHSSLFMNAPTVPSGQRDSVSNDNYEVPDPSPADHAAMDRVLRDIKNNPQPTQIENRERTSAAGDTLSFDDVSDFNRDQDPSASTLIDEVDFDAATHLDNEPPVVEDFSLNYYRAMHYFVQNRSDLHNLREKINNKIYSGTYSKDDVARFVREKIELFIAEDVLRGVASAGDGGGQRVLWDHIGMIAEENGIAIPGFESEDTPPSKVEQQLPRPTNPEKGPRW